ncbi:MAG: hypothetical protein ACKVON_15355 [Beijerinckiaceae bacterium]
MRHHATKRFWDTYDILPAKVRSRADKAYDLMKTDPSHPSLHFKKVGDFWSVRIDLNHRALAYQRSDGFVWVWIGSHKEYERLIK